MTNSTLLDDLTQRFGPKRVLQQPAQLRPYVSDALTAFRSDPAAVVLAESHDTERADAATDELWRALLGPDADALETITRGPLPAAGPDTYVDIRRI